MLDIQHFTKNKNKISYTLKKAYDIGLSDSDPENSYESMKRINKMKNYITSKNLSKQIVYSECNLDFKEFVPNLTKKYNFNNLFESITVQYLIDDMVIDDMMNCFLNEMMERKKIIFINLCIYNYNTERCEFDESVHGTSIILIPNYKKKSKYNLYYVNSHGQDMKDAKEFHIILTQKRCKVYKFNDIIDFLFLEKYVKYLNNYCKTCSILYEKNSNYNYMGANLQGGDSHGFCFAFPYLIYHHMCKYYNKKLTKNNTTISSFKTLLLNGKINIAVHSCFIDYLKINFTKENLSNIDLLDDTVVKMDYRFVKKLGNTFVSYITQPYFNINRLRSI